MNMDLGTTGDGGTIKVPRWLEEWQSQLPERACRRFTAIECKWVDVCNFTR